MISYLSGNIIFRGEDFIILDVHDIGYKIFLSGKTLLRLSKTDLTLKVYTRLYLREDAIELYGFLRPEELELFDVLNNISGIGPKTALILSSFGSLAKLKEIIEKDPEKLLGEIKGIGKKKMQKIILEITGRIQELKVVPLAREHDEAFDALVSLGFSREDAKNALAKVAPEIKDTDKKIKEALRILGRQSSQR